MKIETDSLAAGSLAIPGAHGQTRGNAPGLFADHLEEEMAKAIDAANGGNDQPHDPSESGADTVKGKGYVGYFKELQAKRMEELRKEILDSMGLTEEDLAKMSPEQRAAVEKIVSEEIQKRLAAEAVMEDGNDKNRNQAMGVKELNSGFLFARETPAKNDSLTKRQEDEDRASKFSTPLNSKNPIESDPSEF
ncbi:MAG: hypothetical protein JEZ12_14670 [Desulfobacterium sp.]|nr:hypothetical protein [Desulfobacterium sp.]